MTPYHWILTENRFWCLVPLDEPNPHSMRRIASTYYSRALARHVVSYYYPHSTGHKQSGWAYHKTIPGAKRWTEQQLSRFWEPPIIQPSARSR